MKAAGDDQGGASSWTQLWRYRGKANEPRPRSAHSLVLSRSTERLVVFGGVSGDDDSIVRNDTWEFDLNASTWKPLAEAPARRSHHVAVMRETPVEMYIFGGLVQTSEMLQRGGTLAQTNDVWHLALPSQNDTAAAVWVRVHDGHSSQAPCNRSEATAVLYDDSMIVFGGVRYGDGTAPMFTQPKIDLNDLWAFDFESKTWMEIEPASDTRPPPPRFGHAASVIAVDVMAHMAVFGGRQMIQGDSWGMLSDLWLLNFETLAWRQLVAQPAFKRAYTSLVSRHSALYLFGGYYRSELSQSGFVYDDTVRAAVADSPRTRFYKTNDESAALMPSVRYWHRAVMWGDKMIVHGGRFQGAIGDMWVQDTTQMEMHPVGDVKELQRNDIAAVYLASLLLAAFALTFLLVLVRCRTYSAGIVDHEITVRVERMGVTKSRLLTLKPTKYRRKDAHVLAESDMCPICLADYTSQDDVRELPCQHVFHVHCIDAWLGQNKLCPMCKSDVEVGLQATHATHC
ncbi:Aste57867_22180 [Aphanomyces stellatus]|uniref:Aste57867_22180 protein n=1 Tax=Aphanomyces stellatus TaxID=120398 RepID=A0A485LLH2_9STRA|nr:hypothetical protein As57867_022111 [Aphanomyces stellatus]VFT98847.1 Aste57867_22180 [Aphanomyces stellatus]